MFAINGKVHPSSPDLVISITALAIAVVSAKINRTVKAALMLRMELLDSQKVIFAFLVFNLMLNKPDETGSAKVLIICDD
ncbi:hypothetical protein O6A27_27620, partial [Escherichia coli]|nr:hypothetical protein [Escherichia coli]